MPSRFTVVNPDNENVTVYVPGLRSSIEYWPTPLLTTVRTFSIRAGLEASTVTPGQHRARGVPVAVPTIDALQRTLERRHQG
jgi:hypothetical protein